MCAVKFRHELVYDADPAAVFAMLGDPAFREKVARTHGVENATVTVTPSGAGMSVVIDQEQPTNDLPGFARAFAGETSRAIQRETWTSSTSGTLDIEAPGKPTSISGTVTLQTRGGGCVEVVELEVKAKIPLVGGKIEKLLAEKLAAGMDVEREVAVAWLKGER